MLIQGKKRIKSWGKYSSHIKEGSNIVIGLRIDDQLFPKLKELGFDEALNVGETLLPSDSFGPIARFNSEGRQIPQKHLEMETEYRQVYWEWKDWHDNSHSQYVDIPYKRYPRRLVAPPSLELLITKKMDNKFIVVEGSVVQGKTDKEDALHRVNIMLEIFGSVELMQESLDRFSVPEIVRLNWDVLPKGEMPWEQFKEHLKPVLNRTGTRKRPVIENRLEKIAGYSPSFRAIGLNGYKGYIIFGFPTLNLYIFESAYYGNATYVFEGTWKDVSRLTKAQIINADLYKHRFIHREGWERNIRGLFIAFKNYKTTQKKTENQIS